MSSEYLDIDGSILEGGGQILRIALTMSVIKKKPVKIRNIRAGRSKPGLMEQHLKGAELLKNLCNAQVSGLELGSTYIEFNPGNLKGGYHTAFVRTAGSVSLLLQAALPCTYLCPTDTTLELHGGTNAEMAPQIDYTTEVFRPNLEKFGLTFNFDLIKRGYFPKGGGKVIIDIKPNQHFQPISLLNMGSVTAIYGWSFVAGNLPLHIANSMADSASKILNSMINNINIESYKENREVTTENGSGIILVAETSSGCYLGSSALGKRNETPIETGKKAAEDLLKSLREGSCVDSHCQDQLIIFMALAQGPSKIRVGEITLHTKTAIFIVEQFDPKIKFEIVSDGANNIIECKQT